MGRQCRRKFRELRLLDMVGIRRTIMGESFFSSSFTSNRRIANRLFLRENHWSEAKRLSAVVVSSKTTITY